MVILNTDDDEVDNLGLETIDTRHGEKWESRETIQDLSVET